MIDGDVPRKTTAEMCFKKMNLMRRSVHEVSHELCKMGQPPVREIGPKLLGPYIGPYNRRYNKGYFGYRRVFRVPEGISGTRGYFWDFWILDFWTFGFLDFWTFGT